MLSKLREKSFSHKQAKKLLYLFEIEATNNDDFYNDLCKWLDKNKISSTIFLRDTLSLRFENEFESNDFFNAWGSLDTFIIQVREGR